MQRCGRQRHFLEIGRRWGRLAAAGTAEVLARLIAIAAVDRAAGPDADDVAGTDATFNVERDLRPSLGTNRRLQEILRHIMCQYAAFNLGRTGDQCEAQEYAQTECPHL